MSPAKRYSVLINAIKKLHVTLLKKPFLAVDCSYNGLLVY